MKIFVALFVIAPLVAGCAWNGAQASRDCAGTTGCISSMPPTGYGPLHAQAAAPPSVPATQPQ